MQAERKGHERRALIHRAGYGVKADGPSMSYNATKHVRAAVAANERVSRAAASVCLQLTVT